MINQFLEYLGLALLLYAAIFVLTFFVLLIKDARREAAGRKRRRLRP